MRIDIRLLCSSLFGCRVAYYILCLLFPFPMRADEEDIAAWAIVGHEEGPMSTSSASSQDGVEKSAGAA